MHCNVIKGVSLIWIILPLNIDSITFHILGSAISPHRTLRQNQTLKVSEIILINRPKSEPCDSLRRSLQFDLAAKTKDALDVASQTPLALLLHLVIERREGHMVESKVKKQGFAGNWLEIRRELDKIRLLSNKGGVKMEGLQAIAKGLHGGKAQQ